MTEPDSSQELVHIPAGLPRRMYYWMQDRAGDDDGVTVSASLQKMVDQLGSNRQHVIKSIHSLEDAGVVEVTRTKNEWGIPGPNTYTVIPAKNLRREILSRVVEALGITMGGATRLLDNARRAFYQGGTIQEIAEGTGFIFVTENDEEMIASLLFDKEQLVSEDGETFLW